MEVKIPRRLSFVALSEFCRQLMRYTSEDANMDAAEEIIGIVKEAERVFKENLGRWVAKLDENELQKVSDMIFRAAKLLAEKPNEIARREFCATSKTIAIMIETIRKIQQL